MKTFVFKIALLSFLILVSSMFMLLYDPPKRAIKNENFMAAIVDKHRRLESMPPPRLIFVGGSNLAFGIDSQRIEAAIGIPTTNMSLHAGLGMPFMLKEVEQTLAKDDIVVLSFEYDINHLLTGDQNLRTYTVNIFPTAIQYLDLPFDLAQTAAHRLNSMRYIIREYVENIQKIAISVRQNNNTKEFDNALNNSPYRRAAFSKSGDFVGHLNREPVKKLGGVGILRNQDYDRFISRVNKFARVAKSRGTSAYFMFPPYALSVFKLNEREITKYQRACVAKLEVKIINAPEDFAYPNEYFYDTVYHVNKIGRDLMTTMVVHMLANITAQKGQRNTR